MKGTPLTHHILLECGTKPNVLFRQNVGFAWVGNGEPLQARTTRTVTLQPGDVVLRKANMIRMGLCEGSPDLVGWRSVEVTPDMVGTKLAVFVGLEVKGEGDRERPKQRDFIDLLSSAGGRAAFVRSVADAEAALADER